MGLLWYWLLIPWPSLTPSLSNTLSFSPLHSCAANNTSSPLLSLGLELSRPLSLLYTEEQLLMPRTHIYVNCAKGRNRLFWGLLSNCHINQSGQKKVTTSTKTLWSRAAGLGKGWSQAPAPGPAFRAGFLLLHSPGGGLPAWRHEDFTDMEDSQVRKALWEHLVPNQMEASCAYSCLGAFPSGSGAVVWKLGTGQTLFRAFHVPLRCSQGWQAWCSHTASQSGAWGLRHPLAPTGSFPPSLYIIRLPPSFGGSIRTVWPDHLGSPSKYPICLSQQDTLIQDLLMKLL